ncbi:MAG TPA: CYTH and CHAD domain-containing protein [Gaiellales bacterium]|jgi:CHAD domain-containing protein|nr:CYTH and CHAD domain-containing protein [Gaiellales bacterium]
MERERKLSVEPGFVLPPLPVDAEPRDLRAIYYDTPGHRLTRHGVTLRRRSENGREFWQLKLPADGDRLELEWDAEGPEIPGELTWLLTAYLRGSELEPIAELHTLRRAVRVSAKDHESAEVVHDSVQVLDGTRVVREFDEVEIEQTTDGSEQLVARLERALRAAGAKSSDGRPKVFQALGLPAARSARPKRSAETIEHLRAYLQAQLEALLRSDPMTRRGDGAALHGMRVATRRTRSALKEARRLLDPAWVKETRDELKWLGGVLGDVRDSDVFAAYVESEVARLGGNAEEGGRDLVQLIGERSQPARARLDETLDSHRYLALLDRLEATRESLPVTPARETVRCIVRRAAQRVRCKLPTVSPSAGDKQLHELRIAAKRARYAAELASGAEGRPARRVAKRATDLQTILGEHQDAVIAEQHLQELAGDATPAAAFVAGRLAERQRDRRAAARAGLPAVAKRFASAAKRL